MDAETGVIRATGKASSYRKLEEETRKGWPQSLQRERGPADSWISGFWLAAPRENTFLLC